MASLIGNIISSLSCSDLYKYVLNSMHCHSKCSDCFECDCETNEIPVEEEHHDNIPLLCCICENDFTSDSEPEPGK